MESMDVDKQEPNPRNGVSLPDGAEPASAEENAEPVKTLTQRMMAIRADASGIDKEQMGKEGSSYSMRSHTIEGVLHGVRPLFDKHGVWMLPCLDKLEYTGNRCDVVYRFDFQNVDDPDDNFAIRWPGAGTDNADKALAKAGTNALKEMLKKVFLITDREDEKEEAAPVEYRSAEGATRAEVDQAMDQARDALTQWAKTFKAALEGAKSKKDIKRLQRENKDQLSDEKLPDVTRTFFMELIQKLEGELPE